MKKVVSTCIYCGCGCKLNYHVQNNKIAKISGFSGDDISEGKPCIKGLTINEIFNKNRIKFPMIRKKGKLIKATLDEAIELILKKTGEVKPQEIFLNGSGKITNEDNYLIYRLGKEIFKTNNIDSCCGRLCHFSTVRGLSDCFGYPNLTKMSSLKNIDSMFVIGSNPAENYPTFWNKVVKKKIKIISVQSLANLTSKFDRTPLNINPGSETALINGIINYLLQKKLYDKNSEKLFNFNLLKKIVGKYSLKEVSKICGVTEKDLLETCKDVGKSKNIGVFHGMGFTQHINSLENVHSLMNLAILKNAQMFTLRGEINVQGVGDVFSFDKQLNGNIIKSFFLEPCKVAFITEFNPAQSLPDINQLEKNFKEMFIIYLGSFFNRTTEFADVIIPLPLLIETEGTISNGEQRIRKVNKVIEGNGYDILELAKRLADKKKISGFNYKNKKRIFDELIKKVEFYKKLNSKEIYSGRDAFPEKKIKFKKFYPEEYKGKEVETDKEFNLILTTFREAHQFLTGEITGSSKTLSKLDKDKLHIFINQKDADKLKLKDNNKIKISSQAGNILGFTRISENVSEGIVATRFHYKDMLVNKLFPLKFDDVTFTPNYKCCAVKIEKI